MDMSYMFYNCKSLISLPDISNWNTSNVIDMSYMFYNCTSLNYISDIENWNIKSLNSINYMFFNCYSLKSLPNISKWNNIQNKEYIFVGIDRNIKLKYKNKLKDFISEEFNIQYKINDSEKELKVFGKEFVKINHNNCILLINNNPRELSEYLNPRDINYLEKNDNRLFAKLIMGKKINNISHMFDNCSNLLSLSDISNFDTSKITNMSYMFYNCKSLTSLPDISNWNTSNVIDMSYMFYNCNSLNYISDIKNWNIKSLNNINYMFYNCTSLKVLPNISEWNNIQNKEYIFAGIDENIKLNYKNQLKDFIYDEFNIQYKIMIHLRN